MQLKIKYNNKTYRPIQSTTTTASRESSYTETTAISIASAIDSYTSSTYITFTAPDLTYFWYKDTKSGTYNGYGGTWTAQTLTTSVNFESASTMVNTTHFRISNTCRYKTSSSSSGAYWGTVTSSYSISTYLQLSGTGFSIMSTSNTTRTSLQMTSAMNFGLAMGASVYDTSVSIIGYRTSSVSNFRNTAIAKTSIYIVKRNTARRTLTTYSYRYHYYKYTTVAKNAVSNTSWLTSTNLTGVLTRSSQYDTTSTI